MKVQVLDIQRQKQTSSYSVEVLVGENLHTFLIEVEEAKIGDDTIQVAGGGRCPWETLQYNPRVIGQIDRLVLNVYNGQEIALPVTITEHLPISPLTKKMAAVNGHNGYHTPRPRERHELLQPPLFRTGSVDLVVEWFLIARPQSSLAPAHQSPNLRDTKRKRADSYKAKKPPY